MRARTIDRGEGGGGLVELYCIVYNNVCFSNLQKNRKIKVSANLNG